MSGGVPEVSVLVNCYNGAAYLEQALTSVVEQTWTDWELVFWDNQSTDDSAAIVAGFDDPRMRYLRAPQHTNLGAARAMASRYFRGRWIAFLDCDDLWRADKLERQLACGADAAGLGFVYGRTALRVEGRAGAVYDHPFRKHPQGLPQGNIYRYLLRGNYISVPSLLVARRAFDQVGGFAGKYPIMEDYCLTLRLARRFRVRAVDAVVCEYRLHGANASLADNQDHFEDLDIVRGHFPDGAALIAAMRIIARHVRKCARSGRMPALMPIARTLLHTTYR